MSTPSSDVPNPWSAPPELPASAGGASRWSTPAAVPPAGYVAAAGYVPSQPPYGQPGGWAPGAYAPPRPRSLGGLGTTTAVLLACQGAVAVVAAGISAWGVLSWSRISGAPLDLRLPANDAELLLLALRAPLGVLTGIAFVSWVWVATANARNAGARVRHAPGWALGGWLVPFLSLWRPKQMIDDLWRASAPGTPPGVDLRVVQKPLAVTLWWAAFLIGGSLPAIGALRAMKAAIGPNLRSILEGAPPVVPIDAARLHETVAMWNLWSAVLLAVAAGLAMSFVLRISRWQDARTTNPAGADRHLPLAQAHGART